MVSYSLPSTKPNLFLKAHLFSAEIICNVSDIKIKPGKIRVPQQTSVRHPILLSSSGCRIHTDDHIAFIQVRGTSKSV